MFKVVPFSCFLAMYTSLYHVCCALISSQLYVLFLEWTFQTYSAVFLRQTPLHGDKITKKEALGIDQVFGDHNKSTIR